MRPAHFVVDTRAERLPDRQGHHIPSWEPGESERDTRRSRHEDDRRIECVDIGFGIDRPCPGCSGVTWRAGGSWGPGCSGSAGLAVSAIGAWRAGLACCAAFTGRAYRARACGKNKNKGGNKDKWNPKCFPCKHALLPPSNPTQRCVFWPKRARQAAERHSIILARLWNCQAKSYSNSCFLTRQRYSRNPSRHLTTVRNLRLDGRIIANGEALYGEVAERFKASLSKSGVSSRVPWVRIPPSPPHMNGEVLEWPNRHAWKACRAFTGPRGFESRSLRHITTLSATRAKTRNPTHKPTNFTREPRIILDPLA